MLKGAIPCPQKCKLEYLMTKIIVRGICFNVCKIISNRFFAISCIYAKSSAVNFVVNFPADSENGRCSRISANFSQSEMRPKKLVLIPLK